MKVLFATVIAILGVSQVHAIVQAPVAQTEAPGLDARLEAALEDLERREPMEAKRLRSALALSRNEAVRRIEQHARYLEALADAELRDPEKHRLLLEEGLMEARARDLLEQLHGAPARRDAIEGELRAHLWNWFDLRQALRTHQTEALARELAENRRRLSDDSDAALEIWLARIVDGGEGAMRARLDSEEDEIDVLAPALVESLVRLDPGTGEELARLSEQDPLRFRIELRSAVSRHPELLERARQERQEEIADHRELSSAIRDAHRQLIPLVQQRSLLAVGGLPEQARRALREALTAERRLSERHLKRAEIEVDRHKGLLAERAEKKAVIVEIQLGRMIGRDTYEW